MINKCITCGKETDRVVKEHEVYICEQCKKGICYECGKHYDEHKPVGERRNFIDIIEIGRRFFADQLIYELTGETIEDCISPEESYIRPIYNDKYTYETRKYGLKHWGEDKLMLKSQTQPLCLRVIFVEPFVICGLDDGDDVCKIIHDRKNLFYEAFKNVNYSLLMEKILLYEKNKTYYDKNELWNIFDDIFKEIKKIDNINAEERRWDYVRNETKEIENISKEEIIMQDLGIAIDNLEMFVEKL